MRTRDFNYHLPEELIAHHPAPERDSSRLLVLNRQERSWAHRRFRDLLQYLLPGDLLVLNNSKVIPARLRSHKAGTGGSVEILLVEEIESNLWWAMLKPGKRARKGTRLEVQDWDGKNTGIVAEVEGKREEGHYRLRFDNISEIREALWNIGEVPLPPYIHRDTPGVAAEDLERYQTVFAGPEGSVAAPTAGLHFTPEILGELKERGIEVTYVTLHVGLGTFAPIKVDDVQSHQMHEEKFEVSEETATLLARAKAAGRRVVAVGTTTLRVLESVALPGGHVQAGGGKTRLFVYPPYRFKIVDALLTNFHLPESTLLMLVSAFAAPGSHTGRELILAAYAEAVRERYRFFSYGDAMLIL